MFIRVFVVSRVRQRWASTARRSRGSGVRLETSTTISATVSERRRVSQCFTVDRGQNEFKPFGRDTVRRTLDVRILLPRVYAQHIVLVVVSKTTCVVFRFYVIHVVTRRLNNTRPLDNGTFHVIPADEKNNLKTICHLTHLPTFRFNREQPRALFKRQRA